VPAARVTHPPPPRTISFRFLWVPMSAPVSSPEKTYLMIRNSLVVRHAYGGRRFWIADLPLTPYRGVRAVLALPGSKLALLRRVFLRGVRDAARGRMGAP
jgi:hypothetical protein